jgi:hypothetical protein
MKTEDKLEHADPTAKQDKALYTWALEKTREGAKAADSPHQTSTSTAAGLHSVGYIPH